MGMVSGSGSFKESTTFEIFMIFKAFYDVQNIFFLIFFKFKGTPFIHGEKLHGRKGGKQIHQAGMCGRFFKLLSAITWL